MTALEVVATAPEFYSYRARDLSPRELRADFVERMLDGRARQRPTLRNVAGLIVEDKSFGHVSRAEKWLASRTGVFGPAIAVRLVPPLRDPEEEAAQRGLLDRRVQRARAALNQAEATVLSRIERGGGALRCQRCGAGAAAAACAFCGASQRLPLEERTITRATVAWAQASSTRHAFLDVPHEAGWLVGAWCGE